jgi:hypothetical protein
MRFKSKMYKDKKGDERVITKYCLLPTRVGSTWIWLEKVRIRQRLRLLSEHTHDPGYLQWHNMELIKDK